VKYRDWTTEWGFLCGAPFLPLRDRQAIYQFIEVFKATRVFACNFLESFSIIKIFSLKIRAFYGEMVFYFPETIASFDIFSSHKTPNGTEQREKSIFK
jgi:hypothetical protein